MCSLFTCNKEEIYTEKAEINIELPKSIESIKSDFQVLKTEASAQNYSDCAVELISPFNVDLDWSNSRFDDVASTNEVEVYRVDVEEDDRNLNTLYRTTQLVILKHLEEDVIYPTLLVYEWEEDFTSFKENSFTGGACLIEPGGYVSTLDKFVDNHLTESLEPDSEQMEYCDEGNARGGIWAWIQALFAKDPGCCPSFPSAGGGGWSNFWSSVGNFFNNLFSSSGSGSGNSWTSGGTGGVFWGNGTTTTTNNNPSGGGGGGNSGYNNNNFYNDPITQVVDAIFDYLDCHTSATGNILNNTITHTNSFVQQVSNTTGLTIILAQ